MFKDRKHAGRVLAAELNLLPKEEKKNTVLLALPRGGVPIASEVAEELKIPFSILVVRKIGHPKNPEYGIGAIVEGGYYWMDPDALGLSGVTLPEIDKQIEIEKEEVKRRVAVFREGEDLPELAGKSVILVDDGLATGVTARVAAKFVKSQKAAKVTLAIPVCSEAAALKMRKEIDVVICLNEKAKFHGVGQFYNNFDQVSDEEVQKLKRRRQKRK